MVAIASPNALALDVCLHCRSPLDGCAGPFCCRGCESVYSLLRGEHLEAYYRLRGDRGVPVPDRREDRRDAKWLTAVEERLRAAPSVTRVVLDVQGLHCVDCVWLL